MRGQGTIEYLLIIAVVIVISLIVVSLLTNTLDASGNISSNIQQISQLTSQLAIKEGVVDGDGGGIFVLTNNSGQNLTITKFNIEGKDSFINNFLFTSGTEQGFSLAEVGSGCSCEGLTGKKSCDVIIETTTAYGITKNYYSTVTIECVSDATSSNSNLVESIYDCGYVSPGDFNLITQANFSEGPYTINSSDDYLFEDNLTGNIVVAADSVTLNGNYCTLTGNVSGNNASVGDNAYAITLSNATIGTISSTAASDDTVAVGDGGAITLTNSTTSTIETTGGGSGSGGLVDGGNSGIIIITDSDTGAITLSGGVSASGAGGNSGTATVTDSSISGSITSNGGNTYSGSGGTSGNITVSNSTITASITSQGGTSTQFTGIVGNSGTISIEDSTIGASVNSWGAASTGSITLTNSTADEVSSKGSQCGGINITSNAGTITLNESSSINNILSLGGNTCSCGGSTSLMTITSSTVLDEITATGGDPGGCGCPVGGSVSLITFNPCPDPLPTLNLTAGGSGEWGGTVAGNNCD